MNDIVIGFIALLMLALIVLSGVWALVVVGNEVYLLFAGILRGNRGNKP